MTHFPSPVPTLLEVSPGTLDRAALRSARCESPLYATATRSPDPAGPNLTSELPTDKTKDGHAGGPLAVIESATSVFTALVCALGVQGLQVVGPCDIEAWASDHLHSIYSPVPTTHFPSTAQSDQRTLTPLFDLRVLKVGLVTQSRAYEGWSATSISGGEMRIPRLPHHPRQPFHPFNSTPLILFNQGAVDMGE